MPLKFFTYLTQDGGGLFECNMKCGQCEYIYPREHRKRGQRCKLRVCYGWPYCYHHLPKKCGVKVVKQSPVLESIGIRGRGLIATKEFKPGDRIVSYHHAERIDRVELDRRYGTGEKWTAPYVVEIKSGDYLDGACVRAAAPLINDPRGTGKRPNCEFKRGKRDGSRTFNTVRVVAKRRIKPGDELLVSYGRDYWRGFFRDGKIPRVGQSEVYRRR